MAQPTIPVRTVLFPAFYKDFHCIMGDCQDNCCDDGWRIEFNKKDYLAVKRAGQAAGLEEELAQGMRRLREREHDGYYAEFCVTPTGRCAFHTPEGLCRLQLECGPEVLPKVCRVFPRREAYTGAGLERSLSIACEGVLALLWDLPEGVDFVEDPLPKQEWRDVVPSSPAAVRFADIRSLCIDVLQARTMKLSQRMQLLGLMLQRLQTADWQQDGVFDRWLELGEALLKDPSMADSALNGLPKQPEMFLSENLRVLFSIADGSRKELVDELGSAISDSWGKGDIHSFQINVARYRELEAKLEELLGRSEHFFENIMVSVAFYNSFPSPDSPEELWKSYVNLCSLYSFFRFAAVCGCHKEVSRERLFHVLVQVSRGLIHNKSRRARLRDELFQNDSATLAHMAILVGG